MSVPIRRRAAVVLCHIYRTDGRYGGTRPTKFRGYKYAGGRRLADGGRRRGHTGDLVDGHRGTLLLGRGPERDGMETCSFCRIIEGDEDAHLLLETERTTAFLDENPAAGGHTLVVPNEHHDFLFTDDAALVSDVFVAAQRVVTAMKRTLDPDGVSLFYTSGGLAGQVTHAHVHLVPRYVDDDIHLALARLDLDDAEASRLAASIRAEV